MSVGPLLEVGVAEKLVFRNQNLWPSLDEVLEYKFTQNSKSHQNLIQTIMILLNLGHTLQSTKELKKNTAALTSTTQWNKNLLQVCPAIIWFQIIKIIVLHCKSV